MTSTQGSTPASERARPTPERTLVVWCPDWPLTAAGVGEDEPAAVVVANRVVACSAAARREGVGRGLRRREAQGRCPELVVLAADPTRDARAFEPVVAAVESFSPRVEVTRPGQCAVPTRGPSRYYGGDAALAAAVVERVRTVVSGAAVRVGVADGPFAAAVAARATSTDNPVRVVGPGGSAAFLAPFPLRVLDRLDLVDLLARLGIRALGDLAALPAADVLARFGTDGAVAQRLAQGLDERPVTARTPPSDLAVQRELDPPALRVDTAAFAAKGLAEELHGHLSSQGLACTRVRIEAETEHGERLARLWRHDGALTAVAMAERVRWQLDGWLAGTAQPRRAGPTGGLTLLRLVPDEVHPDTGRPMGFWGGAADVDERVARALARLQGMFGPEAVTTAVLSGGRDPGEQACLVAWGDPREPTRPGRPGDAAVRVDGRVEVPPWPGRLPAPAPAIVHSPALAVEVVDAEGRPVSVTGRGVVSALPVRMRTGNGPWRTIGTWAGPWPVDERWWDPSTHRRRARFQVQDDLGVARLLVLEGGRWWVEATYD